jgi:large subunit ribosomal protein L10
MSGKKSTHVSEEKKERVAELSDLIKNKKTILIASIKNIPSSQYQEISKKLRKKAIIKVPKKNLIFRAIDSSGKDAVKKLKEQIKSDVAILFSDLDSFDLAAELLSNKSPAKAKAGQIAPKDIEVEAGPTDLVPGPAISELGALGIQIQIEKGKINIKESKIIVKEGEKISRNAADIMNKLDIKPFSIGFIPISAFDTKENKLYLDIKIDREETLEELKKAFGRALPFAVEIGYPTRDTIGLLIGKASIRSKTLEKFKLNKEN